MNNDIKQIREKRWGKKPEQVSKSFFRVHPISRKGGRKDAK
ncbi:hypothetical protein [Vibrio sp. ER1A]|nr:hypothetical protein [Vibrio sp. ER1A]